MGANVASVTARSSALLRSNIRLKMFSSCTCLMILEYVHGVHGVCVGVQALEFRDNVDGAELYFCCVTVKTFVIFNWLSIFKRAGLTSQMIT